MNKKDLKRLMELMSKANRTDAENTELSGLQAKANAVEDNGALSEEQAKTVIENAVTKALEGKENVTADQVKTCVETALKALPAAEKIDVNALVTKVTEAVSAKVKTGATIEEVKALLETAVKGIHAPAKMEHAVNADVIDFPIQHRSGNLTVAEKQLLNAITKGKRYRGEDEIPPEALNDGIPADVLKAANDRGQAAEKRMQYAIRSKALTAGGAGSGQEWLNVSISSVLLMRLYLESRLAAAMTSREIQMPANPYTLPLGTTRPVFRSGIAENASPTESSPGSAKVTLTAAKLMGMTQYSDEADEDAIIAVLPMITDQLGQAAADALEDALINGDTTGGQDTSTASDAALKIFDGFRKLTLAQAALKVSFASGGLSATNIGSLRKALGKWGLNPNDLMLVVGVKAYNDLVVLPETLTAEKAGGAQNARIFTGTTANIFGIDIIPSARAREDLNASGVFDNTTTTKGAVYLVHKPSWIQGVKRGFSLENWRDPRAGTNYVIASFRRAFAPVESLANTFAGAIAYNYTA